MRYIGNVTTLEFNRDQCSGCGRCVEVCPHGIFSLSEGHAVVNDRDLCMECGACARNCNAGAIRVNAGVGCAQALIKGMLTGGEATCGCGSTGAGTGCCG